MAAFSLQRVLDLKKRREEAVAIQLADAQAAADAARTTEAELDALRLEGVKQRSPAGGSVPVGVLQNSSYVIERLDQRLVDARQAVKMADAQVNARLAEFTVALQERRVLDRLKEKRMEAAMAEENKADQSTMDAIALTRFFRADKGETGGAS